MTTINIQSEVDGGSQVTPGTWRAPLVSPSRRLTTGIDTVIMSECFNATAQNTSAWKSAATTFTFSFSGGYVNFNNGASATANAAQLYQSNRFFSLMGQSPVIFDISAQLTGAPTGTGIVEVGLFLADATSTPFTATDGAFFRVNSTGVFGVVSFNTTETLTALLIPAFAITAALSNINLNFRIIIAQDFCEFWGSDSTGIQALIARLPTPAANGQPFSSCGAPVSLRQTNGASGSASIQLKVSNITVTQSDVNTVKPWSAQMCGDSQMAYQGQNGGTMGSTALYTNSLAAGAGAVMTNTTAALGSGLGGQFSALPTLAAGTDGILCSYQNPVGTASVTGRTLFITGIKIQGVVTTVLVGNATPVIYAYSLAYGHTAVSMATAEAAATKAPRRVALGIESYGASAALGTEGSTAGVGMTFNSPIAVNPGEFIAICAKNMGVVTVSGVITFLVTFDGYFE